MLNAPVLASSASPSAQREPSLLVPQAVPSPLAGPVSVPRCSSWGLSACLPLPCLSHSRRRSWVGSQVFVGEALAVHLTGQSLKALAVRLLAGVEAEHFLIDVAEKVEGFNANVGALQGTLQQRPEVFNSVGV